MGFGLGVFNFLESVIIGVLYSRSIWERIKIKKWCMGDWESNFICFGTSTKRREGLGCIKGNNKNGGQKE